MCGVNSVPDSQMRNTPVAAYERLKKQLKQPIFNENREQTEPVLG